MARPKKEYRTPIIEKVVENSEEVVEVSKSVEEEKKQPVLIPSDNSVISRKLPTMEPRHVAGKLIAGRAYKIKKSVTRIIYGDFYLLENGLYVSKVGNFIIKE